MKIELAFTIGAKEEAKQERVFTVPASCRALTLRHNLSLKYTFLVFVLLKDPNGVVRLNKQLGFSESVISIGVDAQNTTIGGVPGEISEGRWVLTVFLFAEYLGRLAGQREIPFHIEISCEETKIEECIGTHAWTDGAFSYDNYDFDKVYCGEERWYKGDLHTHTRLSDGRETTENATRKMEFMGLDYYAPTEHNVLHTGWRDTDVLILTGVEVTTVIGHANIFGVNRYPEAMEYILADKDEARLKADINLILKECRTRGWLFSINHPFLYIWKWLYREFPLEGLDCLEIINDPTYESDPKAEAGTANKMAVVLSDILWEDGYRVCAIGGSDAHNLTQDFYPGAMEPSIAGDPATFLYMNRLTPTNILDALRGCRAYVTRHCRIATDLRFGENLPLEHEKLEYELVLSGQYEKPDIFYLQNGKKITCKLTWEGEGTWRTEGTVTFTGDGYQWIRFGAEDSEGKFLFYGNPVTRGERPHRFETFGEAADELMRRWK